MDRRLAMADYGEDYVPTDYGQLLKSEFTLNTKLSPELKVNNHFFTYNHNNWLPHCSSGRKCDCRAWGSILGSRMFRYETYSLFQYSISIYTLFNFKTIIKTTRWVIFKTKQASSLQAKIKQLEDDLPVFEDPLPEMTHSIFGLDHAKIMSRLLAARKKSHDAWSTVNTAKSPDVISYRATPNTVPDVVGNQRKELADFLLQRQVR